MKNRTLEKKSDTPSRWGIASRTGAAVIGGYALASSLAACLSLYLPLEQQNAITAANMLAYLLFAGAVIWAFSTATALRAWGGILLPAAICLFLVWGRKGGWIS